MTTRLVSIVTPCLNAAGHLPGCLDSVAQQTYGNVEHIVVDGGSDDGTTSLLRRTAGIRWISETDQGQSDAIAKGFSMARGTILSWLNADDILFPGAVQKVVQAFDTAPRPQWVYGRGLILRPDGSRTVEPARAISDGEFDFGNPMVQPSTFFLSDLLQSVGSVDPDLHLAMDLDLWLRFIDRGAPRLFMPNLLSQMTYGSESKTGRIPVEAFLEEEYTIYRAHGRTDAAYLALGAIAAYRALRGLRIAPAAFDREVEGVFAWARRTDPDVAFAAVRAAARASAVFAETKAGGRLTPWSLRHLLHREAWTFSGSRRRLIHGLTRKPIYRLLNTSRARSTHPRSFGEAPRLPDNSQVGSPTGNAARNPSRILCHEWLTTYGGSDQVAARLARILDIQHVATYAAWPETVESLLPDASVQVLGPGGGLVARHWRWLLPVMPLAWRRLDLGAYPLVVTSAHSVVNSVRPRPDALLVSYCHTPMRYAWEWRAEAARLPSPLRPLLMPGAAVLRRVDRRWAQRVDLFLANSRFVAGRIAHCYGAPSLVVHPPIDTAFWTPGDPTEREDYFLLSGRMVAYKRPDIVVRAAASAKKRLVVAGSGPLMGGLQRMATPNVEFIPAPSTEQLRDLYRRARGYVFAGVEDFGMSIVEAQACGTPVIAHDEGGARESVVAGTTGRLVDVDAREALADALRTFDPGEFDAAEIRRHSLRFDASRFDEKVRWAVDRAAHADWEALTEHPDWAAVEG